MTLRVWNGSSFQLAPRKSIWNGSNWLEVKGSKIWNGSSWIDFLNLGVTTTSDYQFFPGSKGIQSREEIYSVFTIYSDFRYLLPGTAGSITGRIRDFNTNVCGWNQTKREFDPMVSRLIIEVSGNLTGTYSAMVEGTVISNAKSGSFDGSVTSFVWDTSLGDALPIDVNPFTGASFGPAGEGITTTTNVQLI
jgi:hypothetical protein